MIFVIWASISNVICDIYDISNDVKNEIWGFDIYHDFLKYVQCHTLANFQKILYLISKGHRKFVKNENLKTLCVGKLLYEFGVNRDYFSDYTPAIV